MIETAEERRVALPNIVVYADLRAGVPTTATLFALSEARRIARVAGASVFALVASAPLGNQSLADLSRPIGVAGADKLLLCETEDFAHPTDDAIHGRALDAAVARVPPFLVLFPAGGSGAILAAPLAARLGAPFVPWCDFDISDAESTTLRGRSRVNVLRLRGDGRSRRRLDPAQIERPIVATLGAGRWSPGTGSEGNLEIDVLPLPRRVPRPAPRVVSSVPSDYAQLPFASILVLLSDREPQAAAIFEAFAADLRVPAAVAVVRVAAIPRAVLSACCPEILVRVGAIDATTFVAIARSPRTRVILATSDPDPAATTPEDVDVVWSFGAPTELVDLVAQIGGIA